MASQDDKTISEQAATWWLRRGTGDSRARAAFAAWLNEDPRHGAAFDALAEAWDLLGDLKDEGTDNVDDEGAMVEVLSQVRRAKEQRNTILRRGLVGAGIAASLAGLFVWTRMPTKAARTFGFSTGPGQRMRQTLADGSILDLDANSSVSIDLDGSRRHVNLLRGRVLFDVAKDAGRPFIVQTTNGTVTVLGTLFTVEYRDAETSVVLLHGHVRAASEGSSASVDLAPGDALRMADGVEDQLTHHVDTAKAMLWREGRLVFENESLGRVVARMNDYGGDQIVVSDPTVANLRLSGIFQAGRNEAFLNALKTYYGLGVIHRGHSVLITARKS